MLSSNLSTCFGRYPLSNQIPLQATCLQTDSTHRLVKSNGGFASCWFYEIFNWLLDFDYYYHLFGAPPQEAALDSPSNIVTCMVLKMESTGLLGSLATRIVTVLQRNRSLDMSLFSLVCATLGPLGWDTDKKGKEKTGLNLVTQKGIKSIELSNLGQFFLQLS